MKGIFTSLAAILFFYAADAAAVSVPAAQNVAINFYKSANAAANGHISLSATLKYTQTDTDGTVDFYVFDISPLTGFVIVSAQDNVIPVLAYSTQTIFPLQFQNTGVSDWVKKASQQIHHTVLQQLQADARINSLWSAYRQGTTPPSLRSNGAGPLLPCIWDQRPYYNQNCPIEPDNGQRCVTGCVATAMSQIMKYWSYPPQGSGSYSYTDDRAHGYSNNIGALSANFTSHTYPWSSMGDYLTSNNAGVATIMSDAGISVAMDYGSDGSGAYVLQVEANGRYGQPNSPCAQYSYPHYFLYDLNTIQGVFQSSYSPTNWINIIENEINSGRPVQYQGHDPAAGGHTWVCDGYDANNYLHMNWGWSGQADGYYAINDLSPGGYDFSQDDAALIGIEPPSNTPLPGSNSLCVTVQGPLAFDSALEIFSLNPDTNSAAYTPAMEFGADQWTWNGTAGEQRGLMKLNLSNIPVGSVVVSATISLFPNQTTANAAAPTYGSNNACYLEQVTAPWTYHGVNWNNQPAVTTANEVMLPQSVDTAEDYLNLNIQPFVQAWVNNPAINYGMMLKMITTSYYNSMLFCSGVYPDTTRRPIVSICYTPPCSAAASFTYQNTSGLTEQFTSTSTSQHGSICDWTFSNSQGVFASSTLKNPLVTFIGQPPFSANLIITDSAYSTCRDTVKETITLSSNTWCYVDQPFFSLDSNAMVGSIWPDSVYNNLAGGGVLPWITGSQWTYNGTPGEKRSFLKFNLTNIPAGAVVLGASISLYADDSTRDGYVNQPTYGTNNPCYLEQVTSPWSAMHVTWNTQPTVNTAGEVLLPQSTGISQDYTNLDITAFVQNWVNNPLTNYGLCLKMITQSYYNSMIFASSYFWDSTRRPRLDICYLAPVCHNNAAFTYVNTAATTVQFTNLSTSPNGYSSLWTFYNGQGAITTSTAQNPTFTFTGPPPFTATLVISDLSHGCNDTITQNITIPASYHCTIIQPSFTLDSGSLEIFSLIPDTNYNRWGGGPPQGWFSASHWTWNGVPGETRSFFKFNLSRQIPAGAVISSATLSLWAADTTTEGHQTTPMYGADNACYLQRVTQPWSAYSTDWNTQPAVDVNGEVVLPQSTSDPENYLGYDVTNFVQNWVDAPETNYGFRLYINTQNYYNIMIFCSSNFWDSTRRPQLNICYSLPLCSDTASFTFANTVGSTFQFTNTSAAPDGAICNWTFYNSQGAFATSTLANPLINFSGSPPYSATLAITDSLSPTCKDSVNEPVVYSRCITLQNGQYVATSDALSTYQPTTNFGGETELFPSYWTVNSVPTEGRSLFRFDVSQVPLGSTILSAKLNLYSDTLNYNGYLHEPTFGAADSGDIYLVTSPWSQYAVTWNTQPTFSTNNPVPLPQSTSYEENYLNLDLRNFVQQWVDNPATNYGMLMHIAIPNYYNCLVFCSGLYADTTRRPMLSICYETSLNCPDSALFSYHNTSGTTVQFTNHSVATNGYTSQWTFYNSQGAFASSTLTNPLITFTGQPPFSARLIITDSVSAACKDTLTQTILINPVTTCVSLQQGPDHVDNVYVYSLSPTINQNNLGYRDFAAAQWTWNSVPGELRGLIKFDLAAIPPGALIQSAKLSLYADDTTHLTQHVDQPTYGANNAGYLLPVTSPWNVSAVTWNNQPTTTSVGEVWLQQSTNDAENYLNMDISGLVQNWMTNPAQNYGLMLEMITPNYYNSLIFGSASNGDTAIRPRLDVCYTTSQVCGDTASFYYINSTGVSVQFYNTSIAPDGYTSHWTFYNSQGAFATSTLRNPFVNFTGQPPFSATLAITDSLSASCRDTVTENVNTQSGPGCMVLQPSWSVDSEAIVASIAPNNNYNIGGAAPYMLAAQWTYNGTAGETRTYFKFDLSSVPAGVLVTSATLSFYADDSTNSGYAYQPTYGTNNACYLQRVTAPWNALGITWNNQPAIDTNGEVLLPQSTNYSENYTGLDVKNIIQRWINNPASNYGLSLKMIAQTYYNSMIFYSSNCTDSTLRPRLDICYDEAPVCNDTAFYTWRNTVGDTVQFTNLSSSGNGFTSYWTFYNSQGAFATSTQTNPTIAFVGQPPFSATLLVTDSVSQYCQDSLNQTIIVQAVCNLPVSVTAQSTICHSLTGSAAVTVSAGTSPYHYVWSNGGTNAIITNVAGGVYAVTVSDSLGCSATASTTVDSTQLGAVHITADTTTICPGQYANICAPSGYLTYSWNSGEDTICIKARNAGNYYVTVSDGGNCTATSNHVMLTVLASPSVSISESGDTLSCYNGTNYQWYYNNTLIPGANASIYVVPRAGNYTVDVTDSAGCQAQSNALFVSTSVSSIELDGSISIYPNPLKDGYWILEVSDNLIGSKVEMYDSKGSVVSTFDVVDSKSKIDVSPEPGVYVLRVISGTNIYIRKLVKL